MTPDTAEFPRGGPWPSSNPWTDDENGIIEAVRQPSQQYALPLIAISTWPNPLEAVPRHMLQANFLPPTLLVKSPYRSSRLKDLNPRAGLGRSKRLVDRSSRLPVKRVWRRSGDIIGGLRLICLISWMWSYQTRSRRLSRIWLSQTSLWPWSKSTPVFSDHGS